MISHFDHLLSQILAVVSLVGFAALIAWWFGIKIITRMGSIKNVPTLARSSRWIRWNWRSCCEEAEEEKANRSANKLSPLEVEEA